MTEPGTTGEAQRSSPDSALRDAPGGTSVPGGSGHHADADGGAERLAALRALAARVLDSWAEADAFLDAPHPLFGHVPPRALVGTAEGTRRVEQVLLHLTLPLFEYG